MSWKEFLIYEAKRALVALAIGICLFAVLYILSGCTSPTKELYQTNAKTCPVNCAPGHWTGLILVEKYVDFYTIVCQCVDK